MKAQSHIDCPINQSDEKSPETSCAYIGISSYFFARLLSEYSLTL